MGKHCIVNQEMIEDTGLEVATHVSKPEEYREKLKLYFSELYTEHMQLERKILLQNLFDNKCNIQVLTSLL
jgi:predicted house-cleaning noncanonical NTP pyrophosphatase (MazG superfamily)